MKKFIGYLVWCIASITMTSGQTALRVTDFYVNSDPAIRLFVREITPASGDQHPPILLVHGGFGGLAAFDLPVPGGSFARDLASKGHKVYIMDVRGWEHSTFPDTVKNTGPLASYVEAGKDIDAVVNAILKKNKIKNISLLGWASGGHWASYYTTLHPDKVNRLIVLNSLYGVKAPWPLNASFQSPADSTQYNEQLGRLRRSNKESLARSLANSIPHADKTQWRDPLVAQACVELLGSFRKDSTHTTPGDFRRESFYMANGHQYWKAQDIKAPVLLVRGSADFWSRPEDVTAYCEQLINAPYKKCLTIPDGTHFILFDKPAKGRDQLLQEIELFMKQ